MRVRLITVDTTTDKNASKWLNLYSFECHACSGRPWNGRRSGALGTIFVGTEGVSLKLGGIDFLMVG